MFRSFFDRKYVQLCFITHTDSYHLCVLKCSAANISESSFCDHPFVLNLLFTNPACLPRLDVAGSHFGSAWLAFRSSVLRPPVRLFQPLPLSFQTESSISLLALTTVAGCDNHFFLACLTSLILTVVVWTTYLFSSLLHRALVRRDDCWSVGT